MRGAILLAGATVKACFWGTRASIEEFHGLFRTSTTPPFSNVMDSAHLDERPHKKRRFFAENSSPIAVTPIRHPSPPPFASPDPTPHGIATSPAPVPDDNKEDHDGASLEGFDIGLLQAVVGELAPSVLQKLKDISGNDVQRGI